MQRITIFILCWLGLASPSFASDNKVIVTLPPLSGLVTLLLPEIKSHCLLPAGADPHHFQLSPRQTDMFNQASLFIRASHDDQGWAMPQPRKATMDMWSKQSHAWLNFAQVQQILPQLSHTLGITFPQYQSLLEQRLAQAQAIVAKMQQQWETSLEPLKNKGTIMQHAAWQGLMLAQNIPVWTVLESAQHGHEHGPQHLEQALNTLNQHPQSLLLGSKRHSNRSLSWLASHHPSKSNSAIIELDALGQCNQPWQNLMQENLRRLTAVL
ncbi:MAG: zinc ABC transporter substrate-binding protein [Mariprofundaceae bacterium]|nr:zinc ABC transporter substrate-binding protein [Mariprofundaceae bacterium]